MAGTTGGPGPATEPTPKPASAAGSGASVAQGASPDDRAELVRLRAEVERLRAQVSQARPAQPMARQPERAANGTSSWQYGVSALLITLGCILAPLAVLAVWTANQVLQHQQVRRERGAADPHQQAMQNALTDKITPQITGKLNVQGLANQVATELNSRGLPKVATLLHSFSPGRSPAAWRVSCTARSRR